MNELTKREVESIVLSSRPIVCSKCKGKLFYIGSGRYKCERCENEVMDDFGKVKAFLEENGPSAAVVIAESTGVRIDVIEFFLKKGRLEIIENSNFYLQCEKCGCSIRYGRYCPQCAKALLGGVKAAFHEDVGECPKKPVSNNEAKMRYF